MVLQHGVDHEVIVIKFIAGERHEFLRDGVFADRGRTMDEDEAHKKASERGGSLAVN